MQHVHVQWVAGLEDQVRYTEADDQPLYLAPRGREAPREEPGEQDEDRHVERVDEQMRRGGEAAVGERVPRVAENDQDDGQELHVVVVRIAGPYLRTRRAGRGGTGRVGTGRVDVGWLGRGWSFWDRGGGSVG